jgi:glycosyltransferase involved in cell wall biosynthesis
MAGTSLAIFLPSLVGGGAERMMLHLARGFAEAGRDVDLVLARAVGDYMDQIPAGVRVVDLKARRVLTALPGLTRYLARRRPAAVLSALDHANLVALWARRLAGVSTPVFVSVRNTLSVDARRGARIGDKALPALARRFYPQAEGIIAVSGGVAEDLVSNVGLAPGSVRVIYNPVVTPELDALAGQPLEHPWLVAGAPPVVLAAGRLAEQKGFSTLIAAFARVREKRAVRLIILGEGPERPRLEDLIRRSGLDQDARLAGFVGNPFAYMRRAGLFALSSSWEGLPGVLIQAMACGTPVVSTDCPSGPREILLDGALGPLVPVGDGDALAAAMLQALDDPIAPDTLRRRAADFSLETISRQYLRLMDGER